MAINDPRRGASQVEIYESRRARWTPEEKKEKDSLLTPAERAELPYIWEFWARPNQLLPDDKLNWQTWLIMAGRGYGKTRVGAETTREWNKRGFNYCNIIAPTVDDARDVCVEGESGILNICPRGQRPEYITSKRQLVWPNGAVSLIFTADEPERLRGKQHMKLWCDELAAWRYLDEAWTQAMLGLRLGANPQAVVTTTPRPLKPVKEMVESPLTFLTRGTTYENKRNLAAAFYSRIITKYEGTRLGRQELDAELLEDRPGALFHVSDIEACRIGSERFYHEIFPNVLRTVGAIDPAATAIEGQSDETGIVFAARDEQQPPHFYVFDDRSGVMSPDAWAKEAIKGYRANRADRMVAEVNNGGDMVEATVRHVDPNVSFKKLHASKGKVTRAEPIAALYEQRRVHHVGLMAKLEDQMCLAAGTLIETAEGQKSIELITTNDKVLTREGFAPVVWAGLTVQAAELVLISYSHGGLLATPCHPIYLADRSKFVAAQSVELGQHLHVSPSWARTAGPSLGAVVGGVGGRSLISEIRRRAACLIGPSGSLTAVPSRWVGSFITGTKTLAITLYQTLSWSPERSTAGFTSGLNAYFSPLSNDREIESWAGRGESSAGGSAPSAEKSSRAMACEPPSTARVLAREKVLFSEGKVPVFNLKVAKGFLPEFYANGVLVHNCDYEPGVTEDSPDRMDALVWALTELSEHSTELGLLNYLKDGHAQRGLDELAAREKLAREGLPIPVTINGTGTIQNKVLVCGQCGSGLVSRIAGNQLRCAQCGMQWWETDAPKVFQVTKENLAELTAYKESRQLAGGRR